MALFGLYGKHTVNGCPLNNKESAAKLTEIQNAMENLKDYQINKVLGQYHSSLEHTFVWIVDAQDPHLIQQFAVDAGLAKFHTVKIVPLTEFDQVVQSAKKIHIK